MMDTVRQIHSSILQVKLVVTVQLDIDTHTQQIGLDIVLQYVIG